MGGWLNHERKLLRQLHGIAVRDRKDTSSTTTIYRIDYDDFCRMYFVFFESPSGGWLTLDHAIEQYEIDERRSE